MRAPLGPESVVLKPYQAGLRGFEPPANGLKVRRSTWLSYRPMANAGPPADRGGGHKSLGTASTPN